MNDWLGTVLKIWVYATLIMLSIWPEWVGEDTGKYAKKFMAGFSRAYHQ